MHEQVLAFVDDPVVTDGNLLSSRTPKALAAFGAAIVNYLNGHRSPTKLKSVRR